MYSCAKKWQLPPRKLLKDNIDELITKTVSEPGIGDKQQLGVPPLGEGQAGWMMAGKLLPAGSSA